MYDVTQPATLLLTVLIFIFSFILLTRAINIMDIVNYYRKKHELRSLANDL